jgi:hypothetical protein
MEQGVDEPTQPFEIAGFAFGFCFMTASGFPRLAASVFANFSFARRCWGVWACRLNNG